MLDKKLQSKILYEENIKSQGHTAKFYNEYVNNTLEIKTESYKKYFSGNENNFVTNAENKFLYFLDVGVRTWNHKMGNKFLQKNNKFVTEKPDPYAAGPVYHSTTVDTKPFTTQEAFIVGQFYRHAEKIFKKHPCWISELTHMDKPWQLANETVKNEYEGKWPHPTRTFSKKNDEEIKKKRELKNLYDTEITKFINSGESQNSITYRLFMICAVNNIENQQK
jgi:hypothetical protein